MHRGPDPLQQPTYQDDPSHASLNLSAHAQLHSSRPLTADEIKILDQHEAYLQKHKGHERAHTEMALILLAALILSQLLIVWWKRRHARSFNLVSLLGFWLIPPFLGLRAGNWRYLSIWAAFSVINGYIVYKGLKKPLESWVPKVVYKFYTVLHKLCYTIGMIGYITILICFFSISRIFLTEDQDTALFSAALILLFYGLYFGILSRDTVVNLSELMALNIGYYGGKGGFPSKHLRGNVCAICGDSTDRDLMIKEGIKITTLDCKHTLHESCLRGWCIVGKKDMCPYCQEKVTLSRFRVNAWDTTEQFFLALLDGLRYLLVWQPLVFVTVHYIYKVMGLE